MIDLGHGVSSAAKDVARQAALALASNAPQEVCLLGRLNDPATEQGQRDLRAVVGCVGTLDGVVVSKSTTSTLEALADMTDLPLVALIETPQEVEEAAATASLSSVVGAMFGSVDYGSDISVVGGWHIFNLGWAKSRIVHASAAWGVWAIAGPSTAFEDIPELAQDTAEDRALEFAGKLCIHPAQLDRISTAFKPSAELVTWAIRIRDTVGDGDVGAIGVDGQTIDTPIIDRARTIVGVGRSARA